MSRTDAIELVSRRALLPLYTRLTGSHLLRDLARWERSQWLSPDALLELQWSALRELLQHAWRHNGFYRERLRALGAEPGDFRSLADYARLPLLTKDDLRRDAGLLLSDGFPPSRIERKRTGGSTGVPVEVWWDRRAADAKMALTLRHNGWAGFRVAARRAALWGNVQPRRGLRRKLTGALYQRTLSLDTLAMDDRALHAFVTALRRARVRHLFGHAHSLFHLARFILEAGIAPPMMEGIISSAEMLAPGERRAIEEVFGPVVFDRYGCEEVGLIASECRAHQGLHLASENVLVEVLDERAGEPGRVVVTDLLNRATPILRYEIGDLATTLPGRCACGRALPRLGRVTGRTSDILHGPEGQQVSGISFLDTVLIHIPGFRQAQVVQEVLGELTFRVVRGERFSEGSLTALALGVARHFGPAMRHRVVFVEKIPLTGRGKFQASICKLGRAATGAAPSPQLEPELAGEKVSPVV